MNWKANIESDETTTKQSEDAAKDLKNAKDRLNERDECKKNRMRNKNDKETRSWMSEMLQDK